MTLRRTWRLAVASWLATGLSVAHAQVDGLFDPEVQPVEDLQGNLHMSDEDIVDILSTRSLMLSSNEAAQIEEAKRIAAERDAEQEAIVEATVDATMVEALDDRDFRLEAILYVSPGQWTFWLNGEAISPKAIPRDLTIRRVTPARVEFSWQPDPKLPHDVRVIVLEPGQIYVADTDEVMEVADYAGPASQPAMTEDDDESAEVEQNEEIADGETDTGAGAVESTAEQQAQIEALEQALGIVTGNAAALGMTEEDLAALRASLAESGDVGSLSAEQQAQLQRIQQATGMEP